MAEGAELFPFQKITFIIVLMLNIQLRELINELSVHTEGPLHKVSSTKLVSVIKLIMCWKFALQCGA